MRTVFINQEPAVKNPKYQIIREGERKYFFKLCARNGEVIITSRNFPTKEACLQTIDSFQENEDFNFVEKKDRNKKLYYFIVTNNDEELIAHSEMYTTKIGRGNGIMAVMKIICDAPTEDITY